MRHDNGGEPRTFEGDQLRRTADVTKNNEQWHGVGEMFAQINAPPWSIAEWTETSWSVYDSYKYFIFFMCLPLENIYGLSINQHI